MRTLKLHHFYIHYSLLWAWAVQLAAPQAFSIEEIICRGITGLNEQQIQMCIQVPKAMDQLRKTEADFRSECAWQFRKEVWNCTGVEMPIFSAPKLPDTKESAFVYSLTSALVVHQITANCREGNLGSACGCDLSRNGLTTPQGWKWGSCSDNVSYGITFAQNFLDARELNKTNSRNRNDIACAEVHLHNNGAGRRVVEDGMKTACKCHGFSGSCSVKTCWRETPTVFEIGDTIKKMYDKAIKVELYFPTNGGPAVMHYYDEKQGTYRVPSTSDLVYIQDSPRYCAANSNFTKGRQCMPQSALGSAELHDTDMDEYYPPCETFCCNGRYKANYKTEVTSCNCTFVWCCEVVCQTCVKNVTEYECTG